MDHEETDMKIALAKNWWALVIRGFAAIVLGVITFGWPAITLASLVLLFGAYALVDGVMAFVGAVRAAKTHESWGASLIEGVVGIVAAAVTVAWPGITALALVFVIASWAILTGVVELVAAVRLRKHIRGEWLLALGGIASVAFGVLIFMAPLAGALVIAIWVGAYALVFGVLMIALGFRLRPWGRTPHAGLSVAIPAH
jgi:uncharacterized membrane protein HdeD (DUF308 family)